MKILIMISLWAIKLTTKQTIKLSFSRLFCSDNELWRPSFEASRFFEGGKTKKPQEKFSISVPVENFQTRCHAWLKIWWQQQILTSLKSAANFLLRDWTVREEKLKFFWSIRFSKNLAFLIRLVWAKKGLFLQGI